MSSRIEKQFTNAATTPILITMSFELNDDKIIERIDAAGGTVPQNDIAKAEQQRMVRWVRDTFIGQHEFFLNAHNGNVPAPGFTETSGNADPLNVDQRDRRFVVVNTIDFSPEAVAKAMQGTPGLIDRILRRDFEKQRNQTTVGAASDKAEARAVSVGHPGYEFAPKVGTYWQDRNRTARFFTVIATHECDGHSHVRMLRVDNQRGGEYEWAFTTPSAWNEMFAPTTADKVPGLTPYAQMAAELYDVSFKPARERKVGMPPELGAPYSAQRVSLDALRSKSLPGYLMLNDDEAEQLLHDFHEAHPEIGDFFRQFLDNVPFSGSEQPPQPGERYYSYISDKTYTVVDARRKLHSQDYYITMDRDEDGHRTKFTYRNHAEWLTVWRPVDDEGNPRKVVEVELKLDTRDASEALRKVGEAAHEAAEAALVFNQGHTLNRIVAELDRRVPGWQKQSNSGPQVTFGDRMIRAIRTLNRMHGRKENDNLREENKRLQATLEARTKEVESLKRERGGSWGPERIRTEQDRMREMVYEYARLFRIIHGTDRLKVHMQAFGVPTMRDLPLEQYLDFMRDCRTYAEKCMP